MTNKTTTNVAIQLETCIPELPNNHGSFTLQFNAIITNLVTQVDTGTN